jgi:hypothetical protein
MERLAAAVIHVKQGTIDFTGSSAESSGHEL